MALKKKRTSFARWFDTWVNRSRDFRAAVEAQLNEMEIEQDLIKLREQRGLSQAQLARILGVSQPAIAKLESGRERNVGLRTLVRCATALGASVNVSIVPNEARLRSSRHTRSHAPHR